MKVTLMKGAVGSIAALGTAGVSAVRSAAAATDTLEPMLRKASLVVGITVGILTAISLLRRMWNEAQERKEKRNRYWDIRR